MFGTIINTVAILLGGGIGLLLKGGIPEKIKSMVSNAIGLAVIFAGASGAIGKMILPEANPILFIISLVLGGVVGELLGIEEKTERLGTLLQSKIRTKKEQGNLSAGFVAATLLFCVGTMSVLGPLESGLRADHSILYVKSMLDGVTSLIMASSLGVGVLFSAGSVLVYQGAIALLANWISPLLTGDVLRELSIVGGMLITGIGLNMLGITKLKIGNFFPAMLVPVLWYGIVTLVG